MKTVILFCLVFCEVVICCLWFQVIHSLWLVCVEEIDPVFLSSFCGNNFVQRLSNEKNYYVKSSTFKVVDVFSQLNFILSHEKS